MSVAKQIKRNLSQTSISTLPRRFKVPTDKLDGSPVECRVLYPFLKQYIEKQWQSSVISFKDVLSDGIIISFKDIRLDGILPSKDDLQYLEVYSTDKLQPDSKIYRLYDAKLKSSMYCFVSPIINPDKDMFRDGMGGVSDPSWLPPVLSDKITDGQPYPVEKFMGRGFFVGVSKSECITRDKLKNLLESNSLDYRQIVWKHNDLNRILNLADQVLFLFSHYYPVKTFDDEQVSTDDKQVSTRQKLIKAISHKIRQGKYSIEIKDHKYTLKNDKETINWEGYESEEVEGHKYTLENDTETISEEDYESEWEDYESEEVEGDEYTLENDRETISGEDYESDKTLQFLQFSPNTIKVNDEEVDLSNWLNQLSYSNKETNKTLQFLPNTIKVNNEEVDLSNWLNQLSYSDEETKNIPSDLEALTGWIEKINELNLNRVFQNKHDMPFEIQDRSCEIKYTLKQQENTYKFSFSHCIASGTRISVEMDGKLDEKQGNGRVDVKIPGRRAMPGRLHWNMLTIFCGNEQSTLAQQGFHTEEIKFQINEAYLQEYHQLQGLSSASKSDKSSAKESKTREKSPQKRKKTKKSLEL